MPTPTPTQAFASEEEAFAAAEGIYAQYLEAAAARGDGDRAAEPQDYLIGAALESDIQSQRDLEFEKLSIVGPTTIHTFTGVDVEAEASVTHVIAEICVDISASRVIDASGVDVTPPDRPERGRLRVVFSGTSNFLRIADSGSAGGSSC
jgi:hypothetical protein